MPYFLYDARHDHSAEQLPTLSRTPAAAPCPPTSASPSSGTGFSGLGAAIALTNEG